MAETAENKKLNQNIIDTNKDAKDGQTKCPKCGATDISLNASTGELRCNFCRFTFKAEVLEEMKPGVSADLSGVQMGLGAADIKEDAKDIVTLKCESCGAEVVINLNETSQARCHWCRNMLSINNKVENGMVPDAILPFKMNKEEARGHIENFVGRRKFFANKTFRKEFVTDNIMGVYFPYLLVDMKGHASFSGEGEKKLGSYQRRIDDKHTETVYRVARYSITRECDAEIDDLAIESSSRRAGRSEDETNNIINAILPFDTENCVKYDSNYLRGFTSEKRDVNREDVQNIANSQETEAIKFALNKSVSDYDRGVRWDRVNVQKQGEKWLSAYLPVWLYSYVEKPGTADQLTHYVAVNARTKETIGSVPINKLRIFAVTAALFVSLLILVGAFLYYAGFGDDLLWSIVIAIGGAMIFYSTTYKKYRNTDARHHFETETKIDISKIRSNDTHIKNFETSQSVMMDANNKTVKIERFTGEKR